MRIRWVLAGLIVGMVVVAGVEGVRVVWGVRQGVVWGMGLGWAAVCPRVLRALGQVVGVGMGVVGKGRGRKEGRKEGNVRGGVEMARNLYRFLWGTTNS